MSPTQTATTTTPSQPPSAHTLSTTASHAVSALTPCLSVPRPSREARRVQQALDRLIAALSLAASSNTTLLDTGAVADVSHALREIIEVSARAAGANKQRPRIRTSPESRPKDVLLPHRPNLGAHERRRLDLAANRIDNVVQVALWKHRDQLKAAVATDLDRRNARLPRDEDTRAWQRGRLGRKGRLFSTGDMKGRKNHNLTHQHQPPDPVDRFRPVPPPNQDLLVVVQERGKPVYATENRPGERTLSEGGASAAKATRQESALRALASLRSATSSTGTADLALNPPEKEQETLRPWEFSLVESPITPLRSRTLASVEDGKVVMAMWRGARVSVKVIRRDRQRFYREGDYLYALGQSPNIPSLLGGHWEDAQKGKKSNKKNSSSNAIMHGSSGQLDSGDGNVGYLILEVANGVSLDKLVRDGKLTDTVSQIRVLDRVVAALVYAQKVDPAITHQDIHPGNILLVPSATVTSRVLPNGKHTYGSVGPGSGGIDLESTSSSSPPNGMSIVGMPPTTSNSTVEVSDRSTIDDSSAAVDILDPQHHPVPHEIIPELPEGDIIIDEFGSPQKKGAAPRFESHTPSRAATSVGPKFPPQKLPQIPKVEEVAEALTVLERVALHNELDASVGADIGLPARKYINPLPHQSKHVKSTNVPKRGKLTRSATTLPSRDGAPKPSKSETASSYEANVSTVSSFTVKVMDFATVDEAGGMRKMMSWNSNETISGYCPPEKVTGNMWRKMHHARDKERDRDRDRERRGIVARGTSNGRHSPRPSPRRRSSNGIGVLGGRSGSNGNHRRKAFDSETYALFGDDHLDDYAETEENHQFDSSDHVPASSLTDRSGRRAAARSPDFLRDEFRPRPVRHDGGENGRTYGGRNSSDGMFKGKDGLLDEGMLRKDWHRIENAGETSGDRALHRMSKIDVWSVGGLLYYMATGKHPPVDCWGKQQSLTDRKEMRGVATETKELIQMCLQRDLTDRACMRDVKRHIDSFLQGLMFAKGLALLESDRQAAYLLLDKSVGIKSSGIRGGFSNGPSGSASTSMTASASADMAGEPGTIVSKAEARSLGDGSSLAMRPPGYRVLGLNQKTRMALSCLPLVVVRRVEWEAAARYLKRSTNELIALRHALVDSRWTKGDVLDGAAAISYLSKRAEEGVTSAQSALGWVYRWGAGGVKKDVSEAMRLWERAVSFEDPEAANGLGLIFHHGRESISADGVRAREYYELAVAQGYPAAAVNLGVMLHDGAAGMAVDGREARRMYEIAVDHEDAIAANNLALLLQHGAVGVRRDAAAAVKMYEVAIVRGERHHACRNLGELLWNGAEGVPRARANAVEYFRQAVERGDEASRKAAKLKLRKLLIGIPSDGASADEGDVGKALLERCWRLVE